MKPNQNPAHELDRRKLVRLRARPDLSITPQKYEGRTYYVVKDPVSLRYYRFKEQEYYLLGLMDGKHTLDEAQKSFEQRFRPERLTLEDLEHFGQQLLSAGLVQNESPAAGKALFENRQKRRRMEWLQTITNILYIKIPVFDPEKILRAMLPYLRWMFTTWFLLASILFMASAVMLVLTHFETFRSRLPAYHEFFNFKTVIYLWAALGVVKVIHEFGHGLSCKAFGGEVHEMGFLLLCLSPAMYCNVSDAWTLPNKWHRIIISAAGIYVELMIAAAATFIWWNTPTYPFLIHMCLSVMVICSVSTVVFNGNPLMRYDGYYVLADWLEIPNLRDRANRYLSNLAMEFCLGIEAPPEQYMEPWRRVLFVVFAIVSYVYRWVVTFAIIVFLASFLKPYKLEVFSQLLAIASVASMLGWPAYRLIRNVHQRGRLPDMKPVRVTISAVLFAGLLFAFFLVPLPVTRVREVGLVRPAPEGLEYVAIRVPGILDKLYVQEGEHVKKGKILAEFRSLELEQEKAKALQAVGLQTKLAELFQHKIREAKSNQEKDQFRQQYAKADEERVKAASQFKLVSNKIEMLQIKAPRDGYLMNIPKIDEVGKMWSLENQNTLFCSIGDISRLKVVVPVSPTDFKLLTENFHQGNRSTIPATVRLQGRGSAIWKGVVRRDDLPKSDATNIPYLLSSKAGGPVAVKPSNDQNKLEPQAQIFLVNVELEDPDHAIALSTMAQVKIHCDYRSTAWWVWRSISSTFDLPLMLKN